MWNLARTVHPEWLDSLHPDDLRAVRSRRDLRRINSWMLQTRIMAEALARYCRQAPQSVLDLGTGDGAFMLQVARRLASRWQGVTVTLLDRQNIVSAETQQRFRAIGWMVNTVAADAFDFLQRDNPDVVDVITANLFFHHFPQMELARLLALTAQRTDVLVACEPRRAPLAFAVSHLVWAIGCNGVSRHDAVVSVRAGFNDGEISASWPEPGDWELHEGPEMLFTHCFVARRTGSKPT
jgi:SAM-dependent methyltransferase